MSVLDKKFPLANLLSRARRILEIQFSGKPQESLEGHSPWQARRCQGKCWVLRSQTGKSHCCPQLSNVRVREKTEMSFLKMQRKGKRPQIKAPPRKFQLCIRKKTCNPSSQTVQQSQTGKGSPALNQALSREVGLSDHPSYFLWINTKPYCKDPLEVR